MPVHFCLCRPARRRSPPSPPPPSLFDALPPCPSRPRGILPSRVTPPSLRRPLHITASATLCTFSRSHDSLALFSFSRAVSSPAVPRVPSRLRDTIDTAWSQAHNAAIPSSCGPAISFRPAGRRRAIRALPQRICMHACTYACIFATLPVFLFLSYAVS